MLRKHIYFRDDQINFIENIPGTFAEHVRQALDEYIEKKRPISASGSKSERREKNES